MLTFELIRDQIKKHALICMQTSFTSPHCELNVNMVLQVDMVVDC